MRYKGYVRDGVVVVEETASTLPEGAEVEIRVTMTAQKSRATPSPVRKYLGAAEDLPVDASQTIDQTLYGGRTG